MQLRSMQQIAYCTLDASRDTGHLETKNTLSEVRKRFRERVDSGVTQQLSAGPADVRFAKTAFAQQPRPEVGLLVLEPFNIGRHGIPHAEVSKKVAPPGIDHDQLAARLHHGSNIAEDILIFANGGDGIAQLNAAFLVQMVDGSH